ncbi:MAG: hypothetical protein KGI54_10190, partial [Pseudomonadota bacterium]|nr:hypothetical protein [Pseudomonadota bacterium]
SCSSGQRFAIRLPSDSQSPAKPLPSANSSPCRASRGLPPPSECALPGAPRKKPAGRRVKIKRVEDMMGISAVSLHIYEGLF